MATRSLIVLVTARLVCILQYWNVVLSSRFLVSKIKEQNLFVRFVECYKDVPLGCYFILIWQRKQVCISSCRQKQRTNKGNFRGGQRNLKWTGNGAQLPVWSHQHVIGQRNQKWAGNYRLTFHVHGFKYLQSEMMNNWGFVINSWLSIIVYVHYSRDWIEMNWEPCSTEE